MDSFPTGKNEGKTGKHGYQWVDRNDEVTQLPGTHEFLDGLKNAGWGFGKWITGKGQ